MLCRSVLLLSLLPGLALCSVFVQYNSASDTSIAMRVVTGGTCKDVYATGRIYVDGQFMFREVAALDGGSGVSLVPATSPGYYICNDGTGTGRLVVVQPALSAALCSFNKVAGLSNPSLVSFEQGGQYIGYAKAFDYDCASNYRGNTAGWTVGLVHRPANPTLATWISSDPGPVKVYIQSTNNLLGNCGGNALFMKNTGDTSWDIVPSLYSPASTKMISLRLSSNSSLYLGIDSYDAEKVYCGSATCVPTRVMDCRNRESLCTWSLTPSASDAGDFNLVFAGSTKVSMTLDRQTINSTLECGTAVFGAAYVFLNSAATLGFWRSNYTAPRTPAVIVNASVPSSSSSAPKPPSCSDNLLCRTCITSDLSCGWCAETGVCAHGSLSNPANCSKSQWFFESCALSSLVAPLVGGIVGGVAVLSAAVVAAVLITRSLHKRKPAVLNVPIEGKSVDFAATEYSRDFTDAFSPMTVVLSPGNSGSIATIGADGTQSSGSGLAMALPLGLPSVVNMNVSAVASPGTKDLDMQLPLGIMPLGSTSAVVASQGTQ
eukprot:m51a1_g6540 hypothetical protein (546) ;mRNA; r:55684-57547